MLKMAVICGDTDGYKYQDNQENLMTIRQRTDLAEYTSGYHCCKRNHLGHTQKGVVVGFTPPPSGVMVSQMEGWEGAGPETAMRIALPHARCSQCDQN